MKRQIPPEDIQRVLIHRYDESTASPLLLVQLWEKMNTSYIPEYMWESGVAPTLNEFIRFFDPALPRMLFIPCFENEFMGMIWLNNMSMGHQASGHFLFFRRWWGEWPFIAMKKAAGLLMQPPYSLQVVLCESSARNVLAIKLWEKFGVKLGIVPHKYKQGNELVDAVVGYITPETLAHV